MDCENCNGTGDSYVTAPTKDDPGNTARYDCRQCLGTGKEHCSRCNKEGELVHDGDDICDGECGLCVECCQEKQDEEDEDD